VDAARGLRLGQLGAVVPAAALDLDELADQLPVAAVEVGGDGLPLRVEAEFARPLPGVDTRM
jgi:hypothetical protein